MTVTVFLASFAVEDVKTYSSEARAPIAVSLFVTLTVVLEATLTPCSNPLYVSVPLAPKASVVFLLNSCFSIVTEIFVLISYFAFVSPSPE